MEFASSFFGSNHQRDEESPAQDSRGEGERKEDLCQDVCVNISKPINVV